MVQFPFELELLTSWKIILAHVSAYASVRKPLVNSYNDGVTVSTEQEGFEVKICLVHRLKRFPENRITLAGKR